MNPSKNAVAQAVRLVCPTITRNRMFALLKLPHTRLTHGRYWEHTYNIRPWAQRSEDEQQAALVAARAVLAKLEEA